MSALRSVAAAFVVCVSSGFTVYVIIAEKCERDAARTGVTWVRRHRTDTVKQGVNMETLAGNGQNVTASCEILAIQEARCMD